MRRRMLEQRKISRAQYDERFRKDDERYARILAALESEVARASTAAAGRTNGL